MGGVAVGIGVSVGVVVNVGVGVEVNVGVGVLVGVRVMVGVKVCGWKGVGVFVTEVIHRDCAIDTCIPNPLTVGERK